MQPDFFTVSLFVLSHLSVFYLQNATDYFLNTTGHFLELIRTWAVAVSNMQYVISENYTY